MTADARGGGAMITGAGRGIGRAVALELCRRGMEVVATMRDPAAAADLGREAEALAGELRLVRLDVTQSETMEVPDGLRILVNNAGIDPPVRAVEHTDLETWRRVFETNLFGLVELTRRAIPVMRAAGGGVICNMTSASLAVPMPFYGVYRASKAAVAAFGESLRAELAPQGIRVVEVAPGPVATDMLTRSAADQASAAQGDYRALSDHVERLRTGYDERAETPAAAARAIADAVCADEPPLRIACDSIGTTLLDSADAAAYEDHQHAYLQAFEPG